VPPDKVVFLRTLNFWYRYAPEPREWWSGGYPISLETSKGIRMIRVELDEIRSAECPKSRMLRSPQSDDLVQVFMQAEAVGAGMGPPEKWCGSFYDAVGVLKSAKARDESAQERAINRA
jgi:hypothetical protein